jgi:hypothetical protein
MPRMETGFYLECGDMSPLLQGADMSDATTSHSTKLSKNDSQVAGYAHSIQKLLIHETN